MRKFYLFLSLIVVLFSAYSALSQTPSGVNSIRLIGSGAYESFKKIIPVTNGYLLIGERDVNHAGEDTAINNEINDVWVVKTNTAGTVEWERSFGGSGTEIGYSGVATDNSGFLILATTNSYFNDGDVTGHHGYGSQIEGDETDIWILKLNNQGDLEWAKTYGGARADIGYSIIKGSDGYYMIAGETKSWDGQLTGQRKSNILTNPAVDQDTDKDAWLFKINLTGNVVWQRCYGGNANEDAHSIIEEPGVGFTIAGYTNSSDIDLSGLTAHGQADAWIFRINNAGTIGLNKTYGGSKHEEFTKIVSYNGKYYAGGRTASNDGDVVGYHPSAPEWEWAQYPDIWLVELAPAGNILQQTCRGTGSFEELIDMLVLPGLGIYLLEFWDGDDMLENFDFAFNLVDRFQIKQEFQSMAATPDGGLYLAGGHFPSYDAPLDLPFNGGSADGLLIRYGKLVTVISAVSPLSGPAQTTVTIKGKNFSPVASENIVYFGAVRAPVVNVTDSALTVTAPANATYQPITVTTGNLTSSWYQPFITTYPGGGSLNEQSFGTKKDFQVYSYAKHVAIGDIDGDGQSDMVVLDYQDHKASVFRNQSTEGLIDFAPKIDLFVNSNAYEVVLSDLDGDGRKDIIIASNGLSIYRNTSAPGSISFLPVQQYLVGNPLNSVGVGDFNSDGLPDIVATYLNSNTAAVLRNNSADEIISFTDITTFTLSNRPVKLAVNDLNLDGRADVAIIQFDKKAISVFTNTSTFDTIAFAGNIDLPMTAVPRAFTMGDMDGDNRPEILALGIQGGLLSIFKNTSDVNAMSFSPHIDFPVGAGAWENIALADLNGDEKPDIVAAHVMDSVFTLENMTQNGILSFGSKVKYYTAGGGVRYATAGDLDGDGKPDLIAFSHSLYSVSVIRNKMAEALVIPSGINPVTGGITNKVTIDPTVQTHQGHPYVQRHYDITPVNNPATATATLTLYFTQQEFDNYNAHPTHGLDLPHNAGDNLNKANLRVYQYHGFSTTSLPGSYSGNGVEIDPDDAKIVWNAATLQWEVTFDVNGFSGFFLGTASNSILPITLLSFTGNVKEQKVLLQWTTTREINVAHFEVQRRGNNSDFVTIGRITPAGSSDLEYNYQYTDQLGESPVYHYRLKIVDIDQSATYSKIITIKAAAGNSLLVLKPNPARDFVVVKHPVKNGAAQIRIVDMFGKTIKAVAVGSSTTQTRIMLKELAKGTYSIVWDGGTDKLSQVLIVQ